jgi:ankyrin repeat protein
MLLKSGAGPNIKTDDGQTPVHLAAKHGNLVTLTLLMEDGGDPLCKSKVILSVVSCLCSIGILCPVFSFIYYQSTQQIIAFHYG